MRVPVLTYHSVNISGNQYSSNDHVALGTDLSLLTDLGYQIVPARDLVQCLADGDLARLENAVVLTCDDGSYFDYYDLPHPIWGMQSSFLNILRGFRETRGQSAQPSLHLTSFVIASPDARAVLDQTCLIGKGWWTDEWWPLATETRLMSIENHSWDHVHPTLESVRQREQKKGSFLAIDTLEDSNRQVLDASRYINERCAPHRVSLFAYPYGEYSDYLSREYLPGFTSEHGIQGAFTTSPEPATSETSRWTIPRYMCGKDWKSPDELVQLLREAKRRFA